ncbi:MAG: iron response transcriptional regulator IrrA [Pseudomonadota bacterium]
MRPYSNVVNLLRDAQLRPTRQRLGLAKLLFDGPCRHVTAEALHAEAEGANLRMSLATVYNTLHQFHESGLLRKVSVDGQRTYFDTNLTDHHHYYFEGSGRLADIPGDAISWAKLPECPEGVEIAQVEVIVRVREKPQAV